MTIATVSVTVLWPPAQQVSVATAGTQGPPGPAGPQGVPGPQGPAGAPGVPGESVTITTFTDDVAFDAYTPGPMEFAVLTNA